MATTLVATAQPTNDPPRVKLDLTWTGASTASVLRHDPDGRYRAVRDGDPATVVANVWTGYDYESWLEESTTYTATVSSTTITSNAVTLTPTMSSRSTGWLRHPGLPSLSIEVELAGDGEPTYALSRAKLEPLGRSYPIVVTDGARKSKASAMKVRTYSLTEYQALLDILQDGAVLLLDVPPSRGWRITHQYMAIADAVPLPIVPSNPHTPWDEWSMPYDVVDRPAGGLTAARTYSTVLTDFASYTEVPATYGSYTALLAGT